MPQLAGFPEHSYIFLAKGGSIRILQVLVCQVHVAICFELFMCICSDRKGKVSGRPQVEPEREERGFEVHES